MNLKCEKGITGGTVTAIPSKSEIHRILIAAAFADTETEIRTVSLKAPSADMKATMDCLNSAGAKIQFNNGSFLVKPFKKDNNGNFLVTDNPLLNCNESGSTLRFILPVISAICNDFQITGSGRLPERPLKALLMALESGGISFSKEKIPFRVTGSLKNGTFHIPGNISSQYITGLLLALPLLKGDSEVILDTELESSPYIDITIHTLNLFGINIVENKNGWFIKGSQQFKSPGIIDAGGDWSNGAFFLTLGALSPIPVTVKGLNIASCQGDKRILNILKNYGAKIDILNDSITVKKDKLNGQVISLKEIPDLLPILSIIAAFSKTDSLFTDGERLRLKESDRLLTVSKMIEDLGGKAILEGNNLRIKGTGGLKGGTVNSFNDHRIVMAAAVAGAFTASPVIIENWEAVNKSYPDFFKDFENLGGTFNGF